MIFRLLIAIAFLVFISSTHVTESAAQISQTETDVSADQVLPVLIPNQDEWAEEGVVLSGGEPGAWDVRMSGAVTPCALIKREGIFYLYYIGSDGDRTTDGGPRHRALGVATSNDGYSFTKHAGNPIIEYLPHNNQEEGVFSCAASLDENNQVVMYYGALRAPDSTSGSVDIDIRLRTSLDGLAFSDDSLVLREQGDELTPLGVFQDNGLWHLYFMGPLSGGSGDLRLLTGTTPSTLANDTLVLSSNQSGGGTSVLIDTATRAMFLSIAQAKVDIRTFSVGSPDQLSLPVKTYSYTTDSSRVHQVVHLDWDTETWMMYYRDDELLKLRTAPVAYAQTTTPTPTPLNPSPTPTGSLIPTPTGDPELVITNLVVQDSTTWNSMTNIQVGVTQYSDRAYTITNLPSALAGVNWIQTANESKSSTQDPLASFTVSTDVDVYVAVDDRLGGLSWLETWQLTGESLDNSESQTSGFSLYKKSFSQGDIIILGPQSMSSSSMYTVIVKPITGLVGDLNKDGIVDYQDYELVMGNFDSVYDIFDLNAVVTNY